MLGQPTGPHQRSRPDAPSRSPWPYEIVGAIIVVATLIAAIQHHQRPVEVPRVTFTPNAAVAVETRFRDSDFATPKRFMRWPSHHVVTYIKDGIVQLSIEVTPLSYEFSPSTGRVDFIRPGGDVLEAFTLVWQALEPYDLYQDVDHVRIVLRAGGSEYAVTASARDLVAFGRHQLDPVQFEARWERDGPRRIPASRMGW